MPHGGRQQAVALRGGIYAPGNKGHIVPDGVRVCLSAACESEGTSGEGGREEGETGATAFFLGLGWINA